MPQMKKATTPPPTQQKVKKYTNVGVVGKSIKHPSQRKRPIESLVYGDEIWEPQVKREKEIVVCFYPFTKNNLRISTCGKFIIEKFNVYDIDSVEQGLLPAPEDLPKHCSWETHWNLFYFKDPISNFKPPEDPTQFANIEYAIGVDFSEKFDNLETVKLLSDKVIEIVRLEFFEERQIRLNDLKDLDKKLEESRELAEKLAEKAESEEEFDELDSRITNEIEGESNNSETSTTLSNNEENEQIFEKTREEETNNGI